MRQTETVPVKQFLYFLLGASITFAFFLVALHTPSASAQATHGFTFEWEDPVTRQDGVALDPDTELKSYRIRCEGAENVERVVDRTATQLVSGVVRTYEWVDAVQTGGWYDCQMTAVDVNDLESDWSEIASVRKLARPMPPVWRGNNR